jgi:hypothetical protein
VCRKLTPLLPVTINPAGADIALERARCCATSLPPIPILPAGDSTAVVGPKPYRIREEEIPREGLTVSRVMCRARGCDGKTYLWIGRRKQIGRGEGSSGLRFDLATEDLGSRS